MNVRIEFENDEDGNQFTTRIWRVDYNASMNDDSSNDGNGGINSNSGGINGGINVNSGGINNDSGGITELSKRQFQIFSTIQKDVHITTLEIAETLDIPQRTLEREIAMLRQKGYICREGSLKKGIWVILKS